MLIPNTTRNLQLILSNVWEFQRPSEVPNSPAIKPKPKSRGMSKRFLLARFITYKVGNRLKWQNKNRFFSLRTSWQKI